MAEVRSVTWIDASYHEHCDENGSDVSPYVCHTVGFVVTEDEDRLVLAMERRESKDTEPFRHVVQIPKVLIAESRVCAITQVEEDQ